MHAPSHHPRRKKLLVYRNTTFLDNTDHMMIMSCRQVAGELACVSLNVIDIDRGTIKIHKRTRINNITERYYMRTYIHEKNTIIPILYLLARVDYSSSSDRPCSVLFCLSYLVVSSIIVPPAAYYSVGLIAHSTPYAFPSIHLVLRFTHGRLLLPLCRCFLEGLSSTKRR